MAKRSRGALYRKTTTRIGRNGKARKIKSGFFRGRYTDNQGNVCDHVLRLPNGAGVKDRDVAGVLLDATLKRLDREAVGMVDAAVENAVLPMVQLVARYIRRKRRAWTKTTTQQTIQQWRWLIGPRDHAARGLPRYRQDGGGT